MSKRKAFFVGFALTLIVLLPLYAGVFLWQVSRPTDSAADTPAYRIPIASPGEGDCKTMLIISRSGENTHFVLMGADALNNRFFLSSLPAETVVLSDGKARTLAQALDHAGPAYAANALAQTLNITIDHYLSGKASTFAAMAENLGSAEVWVPKEVTATSEEGYEVYHRAAGRSILNAKEGMNLLYYGSFSPEERLTLTNALYGGLLGGHLDMLAATLPDQYRKHATALVSDLSAEDIYRYEDIFGFLGRLAPDVCLQSMPGEWQGERYELSQKSLDLAAQWLS